MLKNYALSLGLVHTFWFLPGWARAQLGALKHLRF